LVDLFSEQGIKIIQVKCGGFHSACITEDGQLYTWGQGRNGALGGNTRDDLFEPVSPHELRRLKFSYLDCGPENTIAVDQTGVIHASGDNRYKQTAADMGEQLFAFRSLEHIFPHKTV
jgi:alpha-tubulin suppressor-like RCC1 family protein